jgi:hypothetical protein
MNGLRLMADTAVRRVRNADRKKEKELCEQLVKGVTSDDFTIIAEVFASTLEEEKNEALVERIEGRLPESTKLAHAFSMVDDVEQAVKRMKSMLESVIIWRSEHGDEYAQALVQEKPEPPTTPAALEALARDLAQRIMDEADQRRDARLTGRPKPNIPVS